MWKQGLVLGGLVFFAYVPVSSSEPWPETYVRQTSDKVWNLIMKRCTTVSCRNQLKKIRIERPKNRVTVKKGCKKNVYPPARTVDERIRLCGNAESKARISKSEQSPADKQPRHVSQGPTRFKSDPSPVDKQKKF